jgi:hypothetical protein
MSLESSPHIAPSDEKTSYPKGDENAALAELDVFYDHDSVGKGEDILGLQDVDPALNAKMHLVNNVRPYKHLTSDSYVPRSCN